MSDTDDDLPISNRFLIRSSIKNNKNKESPSTSRETEPSNVSNRNVDKKHMYNLSKELIRVEYPGKVKNVSRAIETLGGMYGIELAAAEARNRLELFFHPENKYNKPCTADRDPNPGLLIRVKECNGKIDYEIVGVTALNFKFNKMCEFQYLPLAPVDKSEDQIQYVHEKILPNKIPDFEYFLADENMNQPVFALPTGFTRYESPAGLYLKAGEKFSLDLNIRPELFRMWETKKPRNRIQTTSITKTVNFQDPNVQVPEEPLSITMELISERNWEDEYNAVKQLFDEKPMWTKIAILHKTNLTIDMTKIILPAVAYFCTVGPWRMIWTKFGYNPLKDFNSRIYQTLDFRIRSAEGIKIKVGAKRPYSTKKGQGLKPFLSATRSFGEMLKSTAPSVIEERCYILSPDYIPPARQMFYQYCNIRIPEIQEMFQRLPKLPIHQKYDPKNGWLPTNFTEQCREIANKYVIEKVHQELIKDSIRIQQQQEEMEVEAEDVKEPTTSYCSKMLNNIKRGIYTSVDTLPIGGEISLGGQESPMVVDMVNLTEGEIEDDEVDMNDVVNSIPETMPENSDDEHLSQGSDVEIDLETVEEINQLIAETKNLGVSPERMT
ncbi:hypothetical protein JTB14_038218 [Gonioctena quinquepunctata]|nr:hypothetical protein JTB14_038218 [Gonioctena quinquepunctata]